MSDFLKLNTDSWHERLLMMDFNITVSVTSKQLQRHNRNASLPRGLALWVSPKRLFSQEVEYFDPWEESPTGSIKTLPILEDRLTAGHWILFTYFT